MGIDTRTYQDASTFIIDGGVLKIGTGECNEYHGKLSGEIIAVINFDKVVTIEPL